LKIDGSVRLLVEAKAASLKGLSAKHIEQAENYASRLGLPWVLLTNGIEWSLFHLTFNEGEGIAHDLAFEANLVENDAEALWAKIGLIERGAIKKGLLEDFWAQKKVLSPASVVRVLFNEEVLRVVRRLLRKDSEAMLDIEDVFKAVRDVVSKEALADAGDLGITKKRKKRRKVVVKNAMTGESTTQEVEVDDDGEPDDTEKQTPSAAVAPTKSPETQSS
jgi:predicted type IV restriction endonuclease